MKKLKNRRENILKYIPYFLVFLLPVIYFSRSIYPYIAPKIFFFNGGVEILAALWIYSMVIDRSYRLPKKIMLYFFPLAGFLIWMTLAGIVAVNPALSFWSSFARGTGLITLYHCFVFSLIIASMVRKYGMAYALGLMEWFLWGASLLAVSVWLGSSGFNLPYAFALNDHGGGLSGNSSFAGAYLLFALAFGIFLLTIRSKSPKNKWALACALAVILFSPVFIDLHGFFSGTGILGTARGATLGMLVGAGLALIGYLFLSQKKLFRGLAVGFVLIGMILFGILWKSLITPDTYLHNKFTAEASGTRFIFWDTAQKAIDERPWFGYGPENYMIAFQHYFNPKMLLDEYSSESWNDRAHNIYYDTGVSGGYPAIALYAFFILSILYALYGSWRRGMLSRIQAGILAGAVAGYVFQNLFVFDSTIALAALFSLAGMLYALQAPKSIDAENAVLVLAGRRLRAILISVLIIGGTASFLFLACLPAQKAVLYTKVFGAPYDKPFNELLKGSRMGEAWDLSNVADETYKALASNASQIKNNPKVLPYVEKDLANFLKYLEIVAGRNKTDYRLYTSMLYLYGAETYFTDTKPDPALAKHLLLIEEHAKSLAPADPEAYFGAAQIDVWSADVKGAEAEYRQAIALDPSIPVSHKNFIQFANTIGNKKLYDEALAEAKKDIPGFQL